MLKTKLFIVLFSVLTAFTTVFAQKTTAPKAVKPTIIGTVTDAKGKAIVGASIAAKGIINIHQIYSKTWKFYSNFTINH